MAFLRRPIPRQSEPGWERERERERETTGGSLGSSTSGRNHTRTRSNGISSKSLQQQSQRNHGLDTNDRETITRKLEWRINNVSELAAHVEGLDTGGERGTGVGAGESPSEVLREGKYTADQLFKFDLGITKDDEDDEQSTSRLTLFICCGAPALGRPPTELFIGIISPERKSGRKYASTDYLWSHTQYHDFVKPNDDFVKIPLPVLSTLVNQPGTNPHDAFVLCIRMEEVHWSTPRFLPPGQVTIPTDLVSALGALIDVPASSDVRVLCLQHQIDGSGRRLSGGSSASSVDSISGMSSRKRVIYANSKILTHRSPYFADLFTSEFAETISVQADKYKTVIVDGADFETVYWMLRFVYTNELQFDETDDHVRDLLKHQSLDPTLVKGLLSTSVSPATKNEWGWHNLALEDDVSSADHEMTSVGSSSHSIHATSSSQAVRSPTRPTASSVAKASSPRSKTSTSSEATATPSRGVSGSSYHTARTVGKGPRPERQDKAVSALDSHSHPCDVPAPACALSMYMLAHRYRLDTLADLAKGHILGHLTHSTCIPILLASHRYSDIHERILDYIHTEWKDVKSEDEFVRCFQEVARGVWGEEGGTILADMVARLPY